MDYGKHYALLIHKARTRSTVGYWEQHHVIPRCVGGLDHTNNLVALYPEEHFFAHVLLLKIFQNTKYRFALAKAVNMMTRGKSFRWDLCKRHRKLYGWLRKEFSKAMSDLQLGKNNSQSESCWISNIQTRQTKKLQKGQEIPAGWILGRNAWNRLCPQCQSRQIGPNAAICKACDSQDRKEKSKKLALLLLEEFINSTDTVGSFAKKHGCSQAAMSIRFGRHIPFYKSLGGYSKEVLRIELEKYKRQQPQ